MIVEIEDDFADEILVANLANTYVSLTKSLKDPKNWHPDDVANWKELLPAMKLVGSWYSIDFDAEIKKAKKRNK